MFLKQSSSASTEDDCAGLCLAAMGWLGDFPLPLAVLMEAPATLAAEGVVINHVLQLQNVLLLAMQEILPPGFIGIYGLA